ncbi:sigma factor-like helix-turn-helix DNA-binding protein [Streptomyces sp. NPDC091294]|uniref:sigma factor-like helix-turn-helix DNA-binding protein n=1 Tax=Streptomyces sp. NPDC091294 TaxID=3365992 RepID=UPI0038254B12
MIEQLKRADTARIGMIPDEDPKARAERQRAEDAVLVERLRRAGFRGPEMELTQERLWAYATVTLNAWCSNRKIVERVRASTPAHAEFDIDARHGDVLRTDPQERIDLVLTAVSGAWPAFFKHALQEGGWNARWKPEGSEPAVGRRPSAAGLRTYFTRGVLQSFPRHYRRWSFQRDRRLAELGVMEDWAVDLMPWWTGNSPFEDESMLVHAWLNGFLASLPAHARHMLRMVYEGYSYAEIGETLGITAKMVTDRIYRLHRRLRERRELLRKQHRDLTGHHPEASADDRMAAALQQRAQQARQTGAQR